MARPLKKHEKHPFLVTLGERIRETRKQKGLSQEAFAYEAGIDRSYIGGIERGEHNITLLNLLKISEYFGVQPSFLLQSEEESAEDKSAVAKPVERKRQEVKFDLRVNPHPREAYRLYAINFLRKYRPKSRRIDRFVMKAITTLLRLQISKHPKEINLREHLPEFPLIRLEERSIAIRLVINFLQKYHPTDKGIDRFINEEINILLKLKKQQDMINQRETSRSRIGKRA